MKSVLVTGATGFVGRALCMRLLRDPVRVLGTVRDSGTSTSLDERVERVRITGIGPDTSWEEKLAGIDVVIHLAARVHVMNDREVDPLAEFRAVNSAGTERLAIEAARAGVRRLVFVSSVKVNGEESDIPYSPTVPAAPSDPYGMSKWEAEAALRRIEAETGLEVVVVRPPLIYGPGVKANFRNLLEVVHRGIPLPFASVRNRRSLVYVGNLADALVRCADHPAAAGKTYLVSDGEDLSTPELIRRLAAALGKSARLFSVPPALLLLGGRMTGKEALINRLVGSLSVNDSEIRRELGWHPPFNTESALRETAEWFLKECGKVTRGE